jgi:hypothetical protein
MSGTLDFIDRVALQGPRNLWEAVALLAHLQEQEGIAVQAGDVGALARLRKGQAVGWAYLRTFAVELVRAGEAPEDMVERLQERLQIRGECEREVAAAVAGRKYRLAA